MFCSVWLIASTPCLLESIHRASLRYFQESQRFRITTSHHLRIAGGQYAPEEILSILPNIYPSISFFFHQVTVISGQSRKISCHWCTTHDVILTGDSTTNLKSSAEIIILSSAGARSPLPGDIDQNTFLSMECAFSQILIGICFCGSISFQAFSYYILPQGSHYSIDGKVARSSDSTCFLTKTNWYP